MEQNTNKDKWIEEILSTTGKMQRVEVSPFMFTKILQKISTNSKNVISFRKAAFGFATVLILAVLNVLIVFNSGGSPVKINTNVKQSESSSEFIPSQYNPYLEILNEN